MATIRRALHSAKPQMCVNNEIFEIWTCDFCTFTPVERHWPCPVISLRHFVCCWHYKRVQIEHPFKWLWLIGVWSLSFPPTASGSHLLEYEIFCPKGNHGRHNLPFLLWQSLKIVVDMKCFCVEIVSVGIPIPILSRVLDDIILLKLHYCMSESLLKAPVLICWHMTSHFSQMFLLRIPKALTLPYRVNHTNPTIFCI